MRRLPFFVLALPRSRTLWLSKFLTTQKCTVEHDGSCEYRTVKEMLENMPDGNCDTALALRWRDLSGKIVIILRDFVEVKKELYSLGLLDEIFIEKVWNSLLEASKVCPTIYYEDLKKEDTCKWIFEYLTGEVFNKERWEELDKTIIQVNVEEEKKRFIENKENIISFYRGYL